MVISYRSLIEGGVIIIDKQFSSTIMDWFNNNIRIKLKTKTSTHDEYEYRLSKYIIPFFKDRELSEIAGEDIQEFIITLENERTKEALAPNTIRCIAMLLFDFFDYCMTEEILKQNPCDKIVLPKRKRRKVVTITKRERSAILRQIEENPQSRSRLVLVALHTGMRLGELTSLKWECVDLKNRIIKVKTTKVRIKNKGTNNFSSDLDSTSKTVVVITVPKTDDSERVVPISSVVLELLKEQKAYESEYVFAKSNGKGYDNRSIQKYFKKLTESIGIQNKSFHTLRHTFATNALESGMDAKTLSGILGHSNVTTTLNFYVHPNEKHTKRAMEAASKYIGK